MRKRPGCTRGHAPRHAQKDTPKCIAKVTAFVAGAACRPTETDWQVCLDEVSFEQPIVMLDGPAFVNQGRKSPCRVIYVERHSSSHPEAVSQTKYKTGMNSESSQPLPRCIYLGNQFKVEGGTAASLDSDSNRKSNRKLLCQIIDGLASGVRHERENEADMPA